MPTRRTRSTALAAAVVLLPGCELLSLSYLDDGRDAATAPDSSIVRDARDDHSIPHDSRDVLEAETSVIPLPYLVYYHFDGDTLDYSGNHVDGTLTGSANVSAPGVKGTALSCGQVGDSLTFPAGGFMPPATLSFSIAFWFQLTIGADGGPAQPLDNTLFNKGGAWQNTGDTDPGVGIGYWSSVPYLQGFVDDDISGGAHWTRAQPAIPHDFALDGRFHHVAFVVDRSAATLFEYVDGVLYSNDGMSGLVHGFGSVDSPELGVLCSEIVDDTQTLNGAIDEFMIVARALSHADVVKLASISDR
jgi:hypothetical protein